MTFGEKLQQLRKTKGLSQEQLAAQVTVSRQAVSKWELDAAMPDTENILQISKLFGVTIDYLLDDTIETAPVDRKLDNSEPEKKASSADDLEKQPNKQSRTTFQIGLIVLAIYMLAFAIAIMTQPKFLPFFAMAATSVSIVVVMIMTKKRR